MSKLLITEYKQDGSQKIDLSMAPPAAIRLMALAFMAGVKKNGRWPYNWRNAGGATTRRTYLAAALRHIQADLDGEDNDKEMTELLGRPVTHIGAAMASLAMLADGLEFGNVIDNRPSNNWEKNRATARKLSTPEAPAAVHHAQAVREEEVARAHRYSAEAAELPPYPGKSAPVQHQPDKQFEQESGEWWWEK